MNRVIATTACVLAAALSVSLLLTKCSPAHDVSPELALDQANAIVLENGATLFDGPAESAKTVGHLEPWSLLTVESRGLEDLRADAYSCTIRWSLTTSEGPRWVNGMDLAIRQSVATLRPEYPTLDSPPLPKDGSAVPATAWFGYELSREWDDNNEACDRTVEAGWLFTSRNGVLHSAQLSYSSGWGTSDHLEQFEWIDLDADGVAELVTDWSTSLTEAGYDGRVVRVLGEDLRIKLEVEVGDPRMSGLGQSKWGRLQLESQRLIHDSISERACPAGAPKEAICFSTERSIWNNLVASTAFFAATANGKPIVGWYHPQGHSPSEKAPLRVLVSDGQSSEWLIEPTVFPEWLGGVFAGDPARVRWVELE